MINHKIQESCKHLFQINHFLEISPKNHIFFKKFNSEFQAIEIWFTNQNSQPLEIEDTINLTLVIK